MFNNILHGMKLNDCLELLKYYTHSGESVNSQPSASGLNYQMGLSAGTLNESPNTSISSSSSIQTDTGSEMCSFECRRPIETSSPIREELEIEHQDAFSIVHKNGCRFFYSAAAAGTSTSSSYYELYIKHIPKHIDEMILLRIFQRFGELIEFRLMMEYDNTNRGYGFIKYRREDDARLAMEVLNQFYVEKYIMFNVVKSLDKSRLFIGNIPLHLTALAIEHELYGVFENINGIKTFPCSEFLLTNVNNRGFAFIDFANHAAALKAKKCASPGNPVLWGQEIRIAWANPEQCNDTDPIQKVKSLFVRNVDQTINGNSFRNILLQFIGDDEILKIVKNGNYIYVEVVSKKVGEIIKAHLHGLLLNGHKLHVEWGKNPKLKNLIQQESFEVKLRFLCFSNDWHPPKYIYGTIIDDLQIQYIACMTGKGNDPVVFFMEISTEHLYDIHGRISEIVLTVIKFFGGLPEGHNYVLRVKDFIIRIVGDIYDLDHFEFRRANGVNGNTKIYLEELYNLCSTVNIIKNYNWKVEQSIMNPSSTSSSLPPPPPPPPPPIIYGSIVNNKLIDRIILFIQTNQSKSSESSYCMNVLMKFHIHSVICVTCDFKCRANYVATINYLPIPLNYIKISDHVKYIKIYLQSFIDSGTNKMKQQGVGYQEDHPISIMSDNNLEMYFNNGFRIVF